MEYKLYFFLNFSFQIYLTSNKPQVEKLTGETIDKYMPVIKYKDRANKENS